MDYVFTSLRVILFHYEYPAAVWLPTYSSGVLGVRMKCCFDGSKLCSGAYTHALTLIPTATPFVVVTEGIP